jgi:hypothetical protein
MGLSGRIRRLKIIGGGKDNWRMASFEYEISYIQSAVEELKDYLLTNELFWPIMSTPPAGGQPFPRLTLGGMLLSLRKASALAGTTEERKEFETAQNNVESLHNQWRSAWENKTQRELRSRLNQWRNYLADYRQSPERNAAYYNSEVRLRVMIQLLESGAGELPEMLTELRSVLDLTLRGIFQPGDFIWETPLIIGFSQATFWYLYGNLKGMAT